MSKTDKSKSWPWLVIPLAVVILVFSGFWIATSCGITCLQQSKAEYGQFGDQFGAVNTLFSGLAFVLFAYTVSLQRKELAATREEFEKQNQTLEEQKIINVYYSNLELLRTTILNLHFEFPFTKRVNNKIISEELRIHKGYELFTYFHKSFLDEIENGKKLNDGFLLGIDKFKGSSLNIIFKQIQVCFDYLDSHKNIIKDYPLLTQMIKLTSSLHLNFIIALYIINEKNENAFILYSKYNLFQIEDLDRAMPKKSLKEFQKEFETAFNKAIAEMEANEKETLSK